MFSAYTHTHTHTDFKLNCNKSRIRLFSFTDVANKEFYLNVTYTTTPVEAVSN